ncbi:Uncharacterised protein [Bordetella pertussis]|nr:Uncharacterised protein [Bordetella pertussis]CFW33846.1 Uncharacterised protein [Bordetella pertussis]
MACTKRRNCALVTSCTSIQNPLTRTWCAGRSLGCDSLWSLPMRNWWPGIQAMSAGPALPSPSLTAGACGASDVLAT